MANTYRVGFARAEVGGLFVTRFVDALLESWEAGTEVTRYGRTWILSRLWFLPGDPEDKAWARIGFVNEGELRTLRYDKEVQDFVRASADSGVVVPLVINPRTGLIAFQLVAGQVRVRAVVSALQSALNAQRTYDWRVVELARALPYHAWRDQVEHVTEFRFRLEPPNPHWPEEGIAQAMLDDLRLRVATIIGKGDDIDTDDEAFQNLLNHVIHDYGEGTLVGLDENGERVVWKSVGGGRIPAVRRVESEGEDEILTEDLVAAIESQQDVMPTEVLGDDEESAALEGP